jgi:hypothetical protein
MKCAQFQQLIDAYLDQELSASLRLEFDAHRVKCDACQRSLTMVEAITNTVCDDRDVPVLAGDFTDRIMSVVARQCPHRQPLVTWRLWTAGAAAMQAAAILVIAILHSGLSVPAPATPTDGGALITLAAAPTAPSITPLGGDELSAAEIRLVSADRARFTDDAQYPRVAQKAINTKDDAALTEIIYTELERQVVQMSHAGGNVTDQSRQLVDYLHFVLPIEDDSDAVCEVPSLDPFTGLLNAVQVLAEDDAYADVSEGSGENFRL